MLKSFRAERVLVVVLALSNVVSVLSVAQQPGNTHNARVDQLLGQMTLEEKIAMIHGTAESPATYQGQAGYLPGIKRLGIPPMRFADGPPGVLTRVPAMALTSTMGLAATFSRQDALQNGNVVGHEARARGVSVALQPFINIARDFTFGRAYNTFGEDPFLTGEMGSAEITGIQNEGIMSQAKHYLGYDTDGTDVVIDEQTLHEVYAAPFASAIKAQVSSIMCSYNRINGPYACGNSDTLNGLLKDEIGFEGFVTSDWHATHAADFINKGLDVEMPGPLAASWAKASYFASMRQLAGLKVDDPVGPVSLDRDLPEEPITVTSHDKEKPEATTDLMQLVALGLVSEETITRAAGRVLLEMMKFGYLDGKAILDVTPSQDSEDAKIVRKTAEDAAVLLKNDGNILPLKRNDLDGIAMIGPGAGQIVAVGMISEKAVGLPELEVGPIDALQKLTGGAAHVTYAVADDMEGTAITEQFFSHNGKPGLERRNSQQSTVSTDPQVNFTLAAGSALPANSSVTWSGSLNIGETGNYRLHLQVLGCYANLKVDEHLIENGLRWIHGDITQAGQDNIFPTTDGLDNIRAAMRLTRGKHRVSIAVTPDGSNAPVQVRLSWVTPRQQEKNYRAAIAAARKAKIAIVFAWSRSLPHFGLPGDQDKLIQDIAAVNPNTVVVLNVGQPVAMPWLGKVKAVLQMWWTGDEGGWATAELLLGQANPAGRLPFTWPKRIEDMPANDPAYPERSAKGINGKTTYSEGILVGYRWFDRKKIEPLFPFGFGLSYTNFTYSGLRVETAADGGIYVTMRIKNSGSADGDEVPQVYLEMPAQLPSDALFADSILAGFERVHLSAGESKEVVVHVPLRQLQYWSTTKGRWMTPEGGRTVWVGKSSRDRELATSIAATLASRNEKSASLEDELAAFP